jgi:hypothetical protein
MRSFIPLELKSAFNLANQWCVSHWTSTYVLKCFHISTPLMACTNNSWRGQAKTGGRMLQHLPLTALQPFMCVQQCEKCHCYATSHSVSGVLVYMGNCWLQFFRYITVWNCWTDFQSRPCFWWHCHFDRLARCKRPADPSHSSFLKHYICSFNHKHIQCCWMKHMVQNNVVTLLFEPPPYKHVHTKCWTMKKYTGVNLLNCIKLKVPILRELTLYTMDH